MKILKNGHLMKLVMILTTSVIPQIMNNCKLLLQRYLYVLRAGGERFSIHHQPRPTWEEWERFLDQLDRLTWARWLLLWGDSCSPCYWWRPGRRGLCLWLVQCVLLNMNSTTLRSGSGDIKKNMLHNIILHTLQIILLILNDMHFQYQ